MKLYTSSEKRQHIIDDLRLFQACIKMKYQKIINLLGNTLETLGERIPKFSTKKWIEVQD